MFCSVSLPERRFFEVLRATVCRAAFFGHALAETKALRLFLLHLPLLRNAFYRLCIKYDRPVLPCGNGEKPVAAVIGRPHPCEFLTGRENPHAKRRCRTKGHVRRQNLRARQTLRCFSDVLGAGRRAGELRNKEIADGAGRLSPRQRLFPFFRKKGLDKSLRVCYNSKAICGGVAKR